MLDEKSRKVRAVGKTQSVRDLPDAAFGIDQSPLRLDQLSSVNDIERRLVCHAPKSTAQSAFGRMQRSGVITD